MKLNISFFFKNSLWLACCFPLLTEATLVFSQSREPAIDKSAPGYVGDCVDRLYKNPPNFVKPATITREQFVAVVKIGIDIYNSGKDLDSQELIEKFEVTKYYIQHCGEHLATNGPLLKLWWQGESGLPYVSEYGSTFLQFFSQQSQKWMSFSFAPVKIDSKGCYLRSELMRVLGDTSPTPTSNRAIWNLVWEKKIGSKADRNLRFIGTFNQDCLSTITLISEHNK